MPWYKDWFDSPYYHLLYKNRDFHDSKLLIGSLESKHLLKKPQRVLDLACGRGRHAIYLAEKGYEVTGVDLSVQNINYAKAYESQLLKFFVHDMRLPLQGHDKKFDIILNLFTSFGYFKHYEGNIQALQSAKYCMASGGKLIIDFFNTRYIIKNMVAEEEKIEDGVHFAIKKYFENGYLFKNISIDDKGQHLEFQERVSAFVKTDFEAMFQRVGLQLVEIYGDYHLNVFDEQHSERMILVAK